MRELAVKLVRTLTVLTVSLIIGAALVWIAAQTAAERSEESARPITPAQSAQPLYGDPGDVYRGENGDLRLSDDPRVAPGVCRVFTGRVTVFSCVPLVSPSGAPLVGKVEEDGSAGYADGLVYDAEDGTFRQPINMSRHLFNPNAILDTARIDRLY